MLHSTTFDGYFRQLLHANIINIIMWDKHVINQNAQVFYQKFLIDDTNKLTNIKRE